MALPPDARPYRRTPDFTEATVPAGLRAAHSTKAGTWGLIHVLEGRLAYRIEDPRRPAAETVLTPQTAPGVVEPGVLHAVEPLGPVRFHVEFLRSEAAEGGGDTPRDPTVGRPQPLDPYPRPAPERPEAGEAEAEEPYVTGPEAGVIPSDSPGG